MARFAASVHLLSVKNNYRLRLKVLPEDESFPVLASLCEIGLSANWFERRPSTPSILFSATRICANSHRLRFCWISFPQSFPISGYVEMHYTKSLVVSFISRSALAA